MEEMIKKLAADAAQVLKRRGWAQGAYQTDSGQCCVVGALRIADRGTAYGMPGSRSLSSMFYACRDHLQEQVGELTFWNDTPGRTADEVIAFLESVAGGGA